MAPTVVLRRSAEYIGRGQGASVDEVGCVQRLAALELGSQHLHHAIARAHQDASAFCDLDLTRAARHRFGVDSAGQDFQALLAQKRVCSGWPPLGDQRPLSGRDLVQRPEFADSSEQH